MSAILNNGSRLPIQKQAKIESQTQTQTMPMIAIERHHLDSIHGPYIVSPLDLAVHGVDIIPPKVSIEVKQFKGTRDQSTQTDLDQATTQSKDVQTDFTSFTRPTHYNYPDSMFDQFLILDASEDLPSNEVEKQAKSFNQDFLVRHGYLFPFKFIFRYFCYHFQKSKL